MGKLETDGDKALIFPSIAKLVAPSFTKNSIFDLSHPTNRDNCFYPYWLLRDAFNKKGIELHTADTLVEEATLLNIHMDVQNLSDGVPCYLLMWETPQICAANGIEVNLMQYRKVFTWNDNLVDGKYFIKINFPNNLNSYEVDGFASRNRFCCLIAGNKTLDRQDERDLYKERVRTIRWFENNAPQNFDLYGVDWNIPVVTSGVSGRIQRRIWRGLTKIIQLCPFPSYRSRVQHKSEVLKHTRFAICYENVRDLPGYITEKIFDCFFSGCVPVYWGASNVTDYIPDNCFIDRRKFTDTEAVYLYLESITEEDFRSYQQHIVDFLASEAARPFSSEFFAETILTTILNDLRDES